MAEIWYVIYTDGTPDPVRKYKYTYHKDDAPNVNTLPNGSTLTYSYDALRRPIKQAYKPTSSAGTGFYLNTEFTYIAGTTAVSGSTTPIVGTYSNKIDKTQKDMYTYEYDDIGNITQIKGQDEKLIDYQYDSLSRLTREDNQIINKTFVYSYLNNTGGNITGVTEYLYNNISGTGTTKGLYAYSTSGWKDQLSSYNNQVIAYDNIGNPLNWKVGMTNLNWTAGRQLCSLDVDGTAVSYTYTPGGTRTSKTVGGVKTEYLLDDGLIMQQKTDNEILNFYYDSAGQIVSLGYKETASSSEIFYFVSRNAQGDVVSIYKSADSKLVGTYTYDAWGRPVDPVVLPVGTTVSGGTGISLTSSGDPNGIMSMNPFRYRGYYYDSETGFYYLQSRYYDSGVKRFINADDVSVVTASLENITDKNLYAYCDNNPVMRQDDSGNFWMAIAAGVGAAVGAGIQMYANNKAGEEILQANVAVAAGAGALTGLVASTGVGIIGQIAVGAAVCAGENAINQAIDNKGFSNFDVTSTIIAGVAGGIGGRIGGPGFYGKGLEHTVKVAKTISKEYTKVAMSRTMGIGTKAVAQDTAASAYGRVLCDMRSYR